MDLGNLIVGVQPEEGRGGCLPAGNYNVMIEKIEGKDSTKGGKYLSVQLRVFGEKFNNAVLFDNINLVVPDGPQGQEIGRSRIARIAQIFGTAETDHWLNKAVTVYAKVTKQEGFEDRNEISSYKAYDNAGLNTTPNMNQNTQAGVGAASNQNAGVKVTTDDIPW